MIKNTKKYLMIWFATTAMTTNSEATLMDISNGASNSRFSSNRYAKCEESEVVEPLMTPETTAPPPEIRIRRTSLEDLLTLPEFNECFQYLEESGREDAARNVYKLRKINGSSAVRAFEDNPEANVSETFHLYIERLHRSLSEFKDAILKVEELTCHEREQIIDMGTCAPKLYWTLRAARAWELQGLVGVDCNVELIVRHTDAHAYEALPRSCLKPAKCAQIFLGKVVRNFFALFR